VRLQRGHPRPGPPRGHPAKLRPHHGRALRRGRRSREP
jgi:hypothetical protein